MKNIKHLLLVLAVLTIGGAVSADETKLKSNVMPEMRERVFAVKPDEIGLSKSNYSAEVWGILMETGFKGGGAYSLVVLADGTTSLYFSTGAGVIGAGQHEQVRKASMHFLAGANHYLSEAKAATSHPLPSTGQVAFYFLSYKGLFSYTAPEQNLGEGGDKLSKLFHAGHQVISEVRQLEQNRQETSKP
jgi:hypothetical protein